MAAFSDLRAYHAFENDVQHKLRFVHSPSARAFLDVVLETSSSRRRILRNGTVLRRAQRGFAWRPEPLNSDDDEGETVDVESAHPASRMVPSAEFVRDGRANPPRILCLYLADSNETALAEVRPWVGAYVSVAEFKVMRECTVVDCAADKNTRLMVMLSGTFMDGTTRAPDPAEIEDGVWGDIANAFSKPVSPEEEHLDYIATQILAEAFRTHGYDGIMYRSLLHTGGTNIALFDVTAAELINCGLYKVESVAFKFKQADNTYFITKHYSDLQRTADQAEISSAEEQGKNTL